MRHGWLALTALVLTSSATAELPEGDLTGQWAAITSIARGGESRLSSSGAALIRDIYKRASDEMHDTAAREIVGMCKRPQDLRNGGQEGLARQLERWEKQQDDVQVQALERIYENLSPEDRKALDTRIEEARKSISTLPSNAVENARSGKLTVDRVLEESCKPEALEQLQRSRELAVPAQK